MADDGKGWTLVARFLNSDNSRWMWEFGGFWYRRKVALGTTTNPSVNADMISPAFWLVSGRENKISAVMTPATLLCYRPQVTVWLDKLSGQNSQVMVTLEMAQFGAVTNAWEAARFNIAASTSQQTSFDRLSAMETSKAPTTSASGVTCKIVMDQ